MKLTDAELKSALHLLKEHGVSDVLPPFMEVAAIAHSWDRVRTVANAIDLTNHQVQPALTLVSPKQKFLVRPVQLLDPLDALLYTGLVRRLAPAIEASRQPANVVFSYRYVDEGPEKFTLRRDWPGFMARLRALGAKYPYVVLADIADFFPNAYLHKLKAALDALKPKQVAESELLYRWLVLWSASADGTKTSQGLPVGPLASNLLAEALLTATDYFVARDYEFARYVDDYYIFCSSENQAYRALHALSTRLMLTERLGLNMAKTRIESTALLLSRLTSPKSEIALQRDEFVETVLQGDPYGHIDLDAVPPGIKSMLEELDAKEMLTEAIQPDVIDVAKLRFALYVLAATRDATAVQTIIDRLPQLAVVSRQLTMFFDSLIQLGDEAKKYFGGRLVGYVSSPEFKPEYQSVWLLEIFGHSSGWDHHTDLLRLALTHPQELVRRQALLGVGMSHDRSLLIDVKGAKNEASRWVRRAALFATRHLPIEERNFAWGSTAKSWTPGNCIDHAVIEYAAATAKEEETTEAALVAEEVKAQTAEQTEFDPDELPF